MAKQVIKEKALNGYEVIKREVDSDLAVMEFKTFVEIKALEDAITIISRMETGTMLGMDIKTWEALKELIK